MLSCCPVHALAPSSPWACEPIRKAQDDGTPDRRSDVERLADAIAPDIGKAVRAALEEHADRINIAALEEALQAGDRARVFAIIGDLDTVRAQAVRNALQDGVWQAGAWAGGQPILNGANFAFDRLNPVLTQWVQTYSLNLIREINDGTREAIRGALDAGVRAGAGPIDQARQVRQAIGLTERQSRAVEAYRKELETIHTKRSANGWGLGNEIDRRNGRQVFAPDKNGKPKDGIERRRLRDFRYDGTTAKAIETGNPLTPVQITRMVDAYKRKYLRHRSETIARTESIRTANAGVHETYRQAIAAGVLNPDLVRRQWIISRDERTCEWCQPIPGMNPKKGVRFGDQFKTPRGSVMLPPEHPNCRCSVSYRIYEPIQLEGF